MTRRRVTAFFAAAACIVLVAVRWANSLSSPAQSLGIVEGRLAGCAAHANCVSSQDEQPERQIKPIPLSGSVEHARQRLEDVIGSMPRSRVVTADGPYVHAEFRSLLFGFVDDVEFAIDESAKLIHMRSASRVGRSDFGVNRKRLEAIRQSYLDR